MNSNHKTDATKSLTYVHWYPLYCTTGLRWKDKIEWIFCLFPCKGSRQTDQLQVQLCWTWDQIHLSLKQPYTALGV